MHHKHALGAFNLPPWANSSASSSDTFHPGRSGMAMAMP